MYHDIPKKSRVWLVGIKGAGMTALAQILKERGYRVRGSDTREKFYTDKILKRLKIPVIENYSPKNIKEANLVIASNAYLQKTGIRNQRSGYGEVQEARKQKIPVLSYPEAVAELFNNSFGIAVAGTHGKSTTAAMIGVMLEKLGSDPSAIVGAEVLNWKSNARVSHLHDIKTPFVIEADEYKYAFLNYRPNILVVTNIEWDHPDIFPNLARYAGAFRRFTGNLKPKGVVIVSQDSPLALRTVRRREVRTLISFGKDPKSTIRIRDIKVTPRGTSFHAVFQDKPLGVFHIRLQGSHHAYNAAAAIACGMTLGYGVPDIKKALRTFLGTRRRLELLKKTKRGVLVFDDYGHHPTEIAVTIQALREAYPKKPIYVLFQPHTFSRTKALFKEFVHALKKADGVYILKTFSSARERKGAVGSEELASALASVYFETHKEARMALQSMLPNNAIFVAMGAGDQRRVAEALM